VGGNGVRRLRGETKGAPPRLRRRLTTDLSSACGSRVVRSGEAPNASPMAIRRRPNLQARVHGKGTGGAGIIESRDDRPDARRASQDASRCSNRGVRLAALRSAASILRWEKSGGAHGKADRVCAGHFGW